MSEHIAIEVVYADPDSQRSVFLQLAVGSTLGQCLSVAQGHHRFSDLQLLALPVGVFGQLREHSSVLQSGDRVEVYRPLVADAKTQRRQRAK